MQRLLLCNAAWMPLNESARERDSFCPEGLQVLILFSCSLFVLSPPSGHVRPRLVRSTPASFPSFIAAVSFVPERHPTVVVVTHSLIVILIVFRLVPLPFVIFHPSPPPRQYRPLTSPAARALTHYGFPTPPKSLAAWSDWWLARVAGQGHRAEKVHEAHKQLGECSAREEEKGRSRSKALV